MNLPFVHVCAGATEQHISLASAPSFRTPSFDSSANSAPKISAGGGFSKRER